MVEALPNHIRGDRAILTIIVKATLEIPEQGLATLAAEQIPVAFGDEFVDRGFGVVKFESDLAPFKPKADVVLVGRAHSPGGRPAKSLQVSLRVGDTISTIQVVGDRRWLAGTGSPPRVSDPEPFTTMELSYERAFGGVDESGGDACLENLVGRGLIAESTQTLEQDVPLPNLEDPDHMIGSSRDRPQPVGFGFYARNWKPRLDYLGTYDAQWQEEIAPNPPLDFRSDFYNAAHPKLQVEGYLRGDEEVELVNLTPQGRTLFQLPGLIPRATVSKIVRQQTETGEGGDDRQVMETIALQLDTLCLEPDEGRCFLVWRGFSQIEGLTAQEVETVEVRLSQPQQ